MMEMMRAMEFAKGGGVRLRLRPPRLSDRYYLSGPMTGFPDYNRGSFARVAEELRALGHEVFSPGEIPKTPGWEWVDYMRVCLRELPLCGVLVQLPGWEASKGARLEVEVARALGLRVIQAEGAAACA